MKYKTAIRISLLIVIAIFIGVILGITIEKSVSLGSITSSRATDKLSYTLSLIDNKYVDRVSRDSLIDLILPDLLNRLDPHSGYIPKEDFAASYEPLVGKFDGIGVMFNMMTDTVLITNVISGGPSAKAGIVAGDKIITVNDSIIAGVKANQDGVMKMLRGERGTKVKVGIQRNGSNELTSINIVRGVIPLKSLEAVFMIDRNTGFIKFSRFAMTTYKEIMDAMSSLKEQGAERFIMDLRENTGGVLEQSILIANEFLKSGQKIVYTQGDHSPRRDVVADGSGRFTDVPLYILINEQSASASEILSGALQDNDRGVILGRRSFGKGLVQEQYDYYDGSAARLTIARYYTPLGRSIQRPYTKGKAEEYYQELERRVEHDELFNVDSIHQNTAEKFVTPAGKVVYGGGGIMPDVFVPLDTTSFTPYFMKLFSRNLIFKYATKVTEENRATINKIKTFDQLNQFLESRNILYDFVAYADRQGVPPSPAQMDKNKDFILAQIKGYIGRNTTLEESAYYYFVYPLDNVVIEALKQR